MAEAAEKATTPRYITLLQAAERVGREELKSALIEGRLLAGDKANWTNFEELARFLDGFALRGAAQADLDAILAISRGAAIPPRSWRRWFAAGSVDWETGKIVRMFADRVVIYQPVLLNADVPAPFPEREPPPDVPPASETHLTPTARWIASEALRLKMTREIHKGTRITDFAKLLETNMRAAAAADGTLRPVGWLHIKNMLPRWGLWPVSSI